MKIKPLIGAATLMAVLCLSISPGAFGQLGRVKGVIKEKTKKSSKEKEAEQEEPVKMTEEEKPAETTSEAEEKPASRGRTATAAPAAPEPLKKVQAGTKLSSDYHRSHVGEIVFSDQVVSFGNEDPSKLRSEFKFGEVIRFRAYFAQSFFNTMVDKFNELGISKKEAYNKGFLPLCKVRYFVDGKMEYEAFYGSSKREYNNNSFPPYAYSNFENAYETNVKYTTYQGSLYNTTFSHDEITHFSELFKVLTPGVHEIKMQVVALDYQDAENEAKHVVVSEGKFKLDYSDVDISENEAICMPKPVKHAEVDALLKRHLANEKFEKVSLESVVNTSDDDGKVQVVKFYLGKREAGKCVLEYRVYNRRYNYISKKYQNEFEIRQVSKDDMPCPCLD